MEWMILPLKRYFDFAGRSRRMEFWMFQLLNFAVSAVLIGVLFAGLPWAALFESMGADPGAPPVTPPDLDMANWIIIGIGGTLYFIWWLGTLIPMIAVTVRRLHDRDLSGWWYGGLIIAGFIPMVNILAMIGWLVFLVFMFLPGTEGPNRFGPNPKDPGQTTVFE